MNRSGPVTTRKATPEERKKFGIDAYRAGKRLQRKQDEEEETYRLMEKWAANGFVSGYDVL